MNNVFSFPSRFSFLFRAVVPETLIFGTRGDELNYTAPDLISKIGRWFPFLIHATNSSCKLEHFRPVMCLLTLQTTQFHL